MSPRTFAAVGFLAFLSAISAEATDPAPLLRIEGGATPTGVCRITFSPGGKILAVAGSGPVRLFDAASGKLQHTLKADAKCLAFAPDGTTLAIGEDQFLHLFNVASGEETLRFRACPDGVLAAVYSPDGKTLATAGADDHVILWDAASGKEQCRLELHDKGASVLAFSPNGRYLTAGGDSGALTVWRLEDDFQDELRRLVGRDGLIGFTAFLPDGDAFVWTQGHTIRVSEVETWVEIARYGGDGNATCFALSPDGKTLATGGDKSVRLWDLETGEELLTFRDAKAEVAAVAFAPNGKTLAAAAPDGAVLIWDLQGLARGRLEALWRELGGANGDDMIHALRVMKATPTESVAFLRERLRPTPPDPRVAMLIANLDDDDFNIREKATMDLAALGLAVKADLKKALGRRPSPEARWRLDALLSRLTDAFSEETARLRAASVLEEIGTDEARQLLEELAKGPPDSRLTREAKASLQRLSARPNR